MVKRVATRDCKAEVIGRKIFENSSESVFSEERANGTYVVYSYGRHFPMYVYVPGSGWYGNSDPFSPTTAKHKTMCRPSETVAMRTTVQLDALIYP